MRWLHGYTSAKTRNAYAVDIGLRPELRAALPGGPVSPAPAAEWAWIRWALDHGIDPAGQLRREEAEAYAHALAPFPKNVRRRRFDPLSARSTGGCGLRGSCPVTRANSSTAG